MSVNQAPATDLVDAAASPAAFHTSPPPGIKEKPAQLPEERPIYPHRREFKPGEAPNQVTGWTCLWPNGEKINAPGEPVDVVILDSSGKSQALFCDQAGAFNEVQAEIGSEIEVRLHFPSARSGEEVWVTIEDGGLIDAAATEQKQVLDNNLSTTVRIGLAASNGKYHAKGRRGRDVKTLRFWAGPLPQ